MTTTSISRVRTIRVSRLLVAIVLLAILAVGGWYLETRFLAQPSLMTIVAEGKTNADPEAVGFTVSVINWGDTANMAVSDNRRLTREMIGLIKQAGVGENDIRAAYVRVIPPEGITGQRSYQAVNAIDAVLKDPARFDALVNDLYSAGAHSLTNIIFHPANLDGLEEEAIIKAVQSAQLKGKKVAQSTGRILGRIVSLEVAEAEAGVLSGQVGSEGTFSGLISTSPEKIELVRSVKVVFELR